MSYTDLIYMDADEVREIVNASSQQFEAINLDQGEVKGKKFRVRSLVLDTIPYRSDIKITKGLFRLLKTNENFAKAYTYALQPRLAVKRKCYFFRQCNSLSSICTYMIAHSAMFLIHYIHFSYVWPLLNQRFPMENTTKYTLYGVQSFLFLMMFGNYCAVKLIEPGRLPRFAPNVKESLVKRTTQVQFQGKGFTCKWCRVN